MEHKNNKKPLLLLKAFSTHTNIFDSTMKRMRPFSPMVTHKIVHGGQQRYKGIGIHNRNVISLITIVSLSKRFISEDDSQ